VSIRRHLSLLLVAALLSVTVPVSASAQDLEQLEAEQAALNAEIDGIIAELESALATELELEAEVDGLMDHRADLTQRLGDAQEQLQDSVRSRWKRGNPPPMVAMFGGTGSIAERASILAIVESRTVAAMQEARGLRDSLASTERILADRVDRIAVVGERLATRQADLEDRLNRVSSQVREVRALRARQQIIRNGVQNGTYACIFDRGVYRYTNSWGAPRSGGRRHKGADVMAPRGVRVYAFVTGRVERMSFSGLGGRTLYLRGNDGHRYYYAHLDGYASGIYAGRWVEAGELLAYNGSTGNAQWSAPHVHFEVHPGGGAAVNPYTWLRVVCP